MLGLKLPTDPRWANIAEKNIEEILTDHAWCEQKAASNAISITIRYPDKSELITELLALAQEELTHFQMVHERILARGLELGKPRKDEYVRQLMAYFPQGGKREDRLVNDLLVSAMIEARSCERFKVLSENIENKELATFYRDLMVSEANHYTLFLNYARKYGGKEEANRKWDALLDFEASIMKNLGNQELIHG
ncbi:MAG TPA: tRNA 2-methylthio-N6-isopentenyl adenosine(37) hydroxylase MiaE [Flavobacteriales bacterium]|nr:tRNA 2-methylthio-N6-isopentenyl adenosine(37) hydroxylase MiaE [Flavobacteriales bacterium]